MKWHKSIVLCNEKKKIIYIYIVGLNRTGIFHSNSQSEMIIITYLIILVRLFGTLVKEENSDKMEKLSI